MDIGIALVQKCAAAREAGLTAAMVKETESDGTRLILASIFYTDVESGGFAKFVYNANGVYLPEMVDVLTAIGAENTNSHLDVVLNYCVSHHDEYVAFLEGDFSESPFKTKLDTLSEAYDASEGHLEVEAADTLQNLLDRNQ
ncbi:Uncharacterised protein [BD1-7 clade bacterium]|uniref:DNA mimic protein DMP19 C-terminal domain-containing protein n=1 Tax=BD1-7 clade bacterium TaxID=2029982 RepID=A0A5S9NKF5_9GAMM|nr:Uncharacterised protein [BD1-7 clade bacterium]CAA0093970.1 Uncharacterised protein [BD1-7 clade bacterium]